MIRIAIVDDNRHILDKICRLVDEMFIEKNSIDSYEKGTDFFNDPNRFSYDIIFLDIDMPDIDGFEIANNLKFIKPSIVIIFVSSMEHFVFESLRYNPFRFVRKSNLIIDMQTAISEYETKRKEERKTYFLKTNEMESYIPLNDIVYFESRGHDLYLNTSNHKFKLKREQSLKNLHEQLKSSGFIRVHKSFLVNYKYIYTFKRSSVILKDGTVIDMNPHNATEIKEIYNQFLILKG